jgi:hypothetical protein
MSLYLSHPSRSNVPLTGDESYLVVNKIRQFRSEIKNEFFKLSPKKENNKLVVSVHIRRDDAINIPSRFVNDEYYIKMIDEIETYLKNNNKEYELTIYTQKNGFNFNKFKGYNIVLDSDMSDNEVWVNILNSDIIIGSNSAFSMSVGMLTDGLYVHTQTDNFPLIDDWLYGSKLTQKKLSEWIK